MNQDTENTNEFRYTLENGKISFGYRKSYNASQKKHFHDFYEVLYLISGTRDLFVSNKTYSMTGGDILLIPPDILHKSLGNRKDSEIFSLYYMADKSMSAILPDNPVFLKLDKVNTHLYSSIFEKMKLEFQKKEDGFEYLINALGDQLFVLLLRRYKKLQKNTNKSDSEIEGKMQKVTGYINQNYSSKLTLTDLSEQFYLSSSYLSRSFHKEIGFSLIEYISNIRVLKAQKKLIETKESILSISNNCGFGSESNFRRTFKRLTGLSPGNYRQKINSEKFKQFNLEALDVLSVSHQG